MTASIRRGIGVEQVAADPLSPIDGLLEAYRAYAEGTEARNNFRFEDAGKFLHQAVAIDPGFAEAHLELAAVSKLPRSSGTQRRSTCENRDEHRAPLWAERRERSRCYRFSRRVRTRISPDAARALDQLVRQFPDADVAYDLAAQMYHPVFGALPSVDKALDFGKAGVAALPFSTVRTPSRTNDALCRRPEVSMLCANSRPTRGLRRASLSRSPVWLSPIR